MRIICGLLWLVCTGISGFALENEVAQKIMKLLEEASHRGYIGEPVSQLEHALQCAQLAQDAGADEETVIAALLHDIGHLCADEASEKMGRFGVASHDQIGAAFLRSCGFSEKVCQLVLGHVQAKRYLIVSDPAYLGQLTEASIETLRMQGGGMSLEEARAFELDPLFHAKIQMRLWDEQAKEVGKEVTGLAYYRQLLQKL